MSLTRTVARNATSKARRNSKDKTSQPWIVVVAYLLSRTEQNSTGFDRIQSIRQEWDDAYNRWVPHITLIPPFVVEMPKHNDTIDNDNPLKSIAKEVHNTCSNHSSHSITLNSIGKFRLRAYSNIHLCPSPPAGSEQLNTLQADLSQSLSSYLQNSKKRKEKEFKPHLSLGQSRSVEDEARIRELAAGIEVQCEVGSIALLAKPQSRAGRYDLIESVSLSSLSSSI